VKPRLLSPTVVLIAALMTAACTPQADDSPAPALRIAVTTTVLGDVVERIVGGDGHTDVLIPVGVDPHDFELSARQIADLTDADLVVVNGLGLEEGMAGVLATLADDGVPVLEIGDLLDPVEFGAHEHDHAGGESADDVHAVDPHVWMDPVRMAEAARTIAGRIASVAPASSMVDWVGRGESAAGAILEMHAELEALVSSIPVERRLLITNHDALGYFADRYGFEVIGVIIPGGSTLAEPSSSGLADLVATIRETGVPAIFADTTDPTNLAQAVASEVGSSVEVVELYTGSIGEPGSQAGSYIGMMLTNGRRLADALGGTS
jgi:zinc/manganese transport system substrate-binding protein